MTRDEVIYLDFAATSALRPPEITTAVSDFLTGCGATPGRGGHRLAIDAGRMALRCRMALAKLLSLPGDPGRIAFMMNATHALNTAMWGTLKRRDKLVISAYDHNAVLRTAHRLRHEREVEVRMLSGSPDGAIDFQELERALDGARLLVLNSVSNVLGTGLPVRALTKLAHEAGALVLVDAAQSAGHMRTNVQDDGVDLVAFTGHKGLLGIQGVGGLWVREGVDVEPLITGGTGGDSALREMPAAYPDHLEAGTCCAPAIAALLAGLEWIQSQTVDTLHAHGAALKRRLWDGLNSIPNVNVLSPRAPSGAAIVTVVPTNIDVPSMASRLDREHGVLTRAGLHCAPEAHRLLGSEATGAVRFSIGWCSSEQQIDRAIEAVAKVTGSVSVAGAEVAESHSC
ncbi:MAG: aminotransferase class V-fold PLP-dependent enzyme [Longimicrobiales bacterium]